MVWGLPPNAGSPKPPRRAKGDGLALFILVIGFVFLISGWWFIGLAITVGVLWWLLNNDDCDGDPPRGSDRWPYA